jgi:DNA adenine methylase
MRNGESYNGSQVKQGNAVEVEPDTIVDLSAFPRLHVQEAASPFRYPGGKGFLTGFLEDRLRAIPRSERLYAEPFCGGAGAAINLLKSGAADSIHLNDADPRVYSAWRAIFCETERFIDRIASSKVDIDAWHEASAVLQNGERQTGYSFELGFATYFINRTSRSGIVMGSGPIGGYDQTGKWKIDARWYKESMSNRIRLLGSMRHRVELTNEDALLFMARSRSRLPVDRTLFFVDPPYVSAGSRLYLNAMDPSKHSALADMLQGGTFPHWILTYDNNPLVRRLYSAQRIERIAVNYSLRTVRKEKEILIRSA